MLENSLHSTKSRSNFRKIVSAMDTTATLKLESVTHDGSEASPSPDLNNGNAEAEEEPCSTFAAARAEIDLLMEEESKFQKFGPKYILPLLKHELHTLKQISQNNPSLVPETRLYQYQIEAILNVKNHFDRIENGEWKSALIVAPAGSGKSGMVALIPYVLESHKVLVLTPSKIISDQLGADFGYPDLSKSTPFMMKSGMFRENRQLKKLLETVNIAATQKEIDLMTASNLVIVNAQKLGGRAVNSLSTNLKTPEQIRRSKDQLEEFDTIIIDEAHHYPASTWKNVVELFKGKKVVFLTATPFRGDSHMSDLDDKVEIVHEIFSRELEGVTIRRTEFIEKSAVNEELGSPEFLEQLGNDIEEILNKHNSQERRNPKHQAMVLVNTIAEAKMIAEGLGPAATVIVSDKDSKTTLTKFTKGEDNTKIAVVCGMLREGYDNSNVSLVVFLRKCKSRVLFEQFCGRCVRMNRELTGKDPDKAVGTILSYQHFRQSEMWAIRLKNADKDPEEEDDDNEGRGNILTM